MEHALHETAKSADIFLVLFLAAAFFLYPLAAILTGRKYKEWPLRRYIFWSLGVFFAGVSLSGPLAASAHADFRAHMLTHLLLGMLVPLLLAAAKPVTLLLRTLSVPAARKLSGMLRSRPVHFFSNPATASVLNIGGLFVLYRTDLYSLMHESAILYALVHLHIFLAGYLFTVSLVYLDITPRRHSFLYRSAVLILALAGHKILAKQIYAVPPNGVEKAQAEAGGMLMYYGGDLIDLALIIILCHQWYKAAAPRSSGAAEMN